MHIWDLVSLYFSFIAISPGSVRVDSIHNSHRNQKAQFKNQSYSIEPCTKNKKKQKNKEETTTHKKNENMNIP